MESCDNPLTYEHHKCILMVFIKEVATVEQKKMGRPTDNPKPYRVNVRLDIESKRILDEYVKQEKTTAMEAVRRGIKKLEDDLKK